MHTTPRTSEDAMTALGMSRRVTTLPDDQKE